MVCDHTLAAALTDMVPVRARRQIVYPLEKLGGNAPSERMLQKKQAYALNHINRKLTLEPKVHWTDIKQHKEVIFSCYKCNFLNNL